jgi:ATP-dependent protease ClpP protease subunit
MAAEEAKTYGIVDQVLEMPAKKAKPKE